MNRKLSILLLCVLAATLVALAACQPPAETTVGPCLVHSDANGDGLCDNCQVQVGVIAPPTQSQPSDLEVSFIVRDDMDEAMVGASVIIQTRNGKPVTTGTVGEDGTCKLTLDLGSYSVIVENLPDYHLMGVYSLTVEPGLAPIELNVIDNTPDGTPAKAFTVVDVPESHSFEAGQTLYFTVRGGTGKYMVIENANVEVLYNGQTIVPDEDGKVTVRIHSDDAKDHISFTVTNKASDRQDITVNLFADQGTVENPFPVAPGQTVSTHVVKGQSIYYIWTATADGVLTMTTGSDAASINLFNMNTSYMVGPMEHAGTLTMEGVKAGDAIRIQITTNGDATEEAYDIDFSLNFG